MEYLFLFQKSFNFAADIVNFLKTTIESCANSFACF